MATAALHRPQLTTRLTEGSPACDENTKAYLIPEKSTAECCIAFGTFFASLLYLCLFTGYLRVDPDEGIILQGAQRVIDGQVLYRDFFSFFTPGSYYQLALIFRIFGDSLKVAHAALAFIGAGFAPVTYLLSRRVCSHQVSLLVTGLMTLTAVPLRFLVLHNWDSTLWACLALYCAVRLLESRGIGWAFAAGSFTSLAAMFEQSKGAGLLIGLSLGYLVIVWKGQSPKIFSRSRLIALALGLAWPVLLTVIYFASQGALSPMLASWFWPLQHYSTANRVPYGYSNLTESARETIFVSGSLVRRLLGLLLFSPMLWFPLLPLFAVALLLRLTVQQHEKFEALEWSYYTLISAVVVGLLLSVIAVRPDYIHFVFLHPIFLLVFAWLMDAKNIRTRFFMRFAPVFGFLFTMSLLAIGGACLLSTRTSNTVVTRRGIFKTLSSHDISEYLQSRVPAGEQILIYPYAPTYYYLTQTYSPTQYEFFQPGMHTREQSLDMLAQLRAQPVRAVLFELDFAKHIRTSWPNTPAHDLVSDPVADYIVREYRMCAVLDPDPDFRLLFMVRKDAGCGLNAKYATEARFH